ncbi:MAG TPA: hypothetical protein DCZ12_01975 [Gammaproteobacteria bacterium]|nr:hypothetical protein [Gammaproteobacteria bacterium]
MDIFLKKVRKKSHIALLMSAFLGTATLLEEAQAFDLFQRDDSKVASAFNGLPTQEITNKLLPEQQGWQDSLLVDLLTQVDIPYTSILEFLNEQEELQGLFQTLEQLPAPVITIATPLQGSNADFVAVAAATTWANQTLYLSEIAIEYLASHLGASFGLSTSGGLGISTGVGGTAGLGATGGMGLATGVGVTAGLSSGLGVNIGSGGSISVGGGASLGLPVTLNDIVTNAFHALRPRFWRVNTLSADSLKTISPILMTIGNPDQNPQTARLNEKLPLYFDHANGNEGWSVVQRRNGTRYEGHVGVISLSSPLPLPEVDFRDGLIGADMITLVIAATDDQGMEAIARVLQPNETGESAAELDILFAYLRGLLTQGMNLADRLERLRYFTGLSMSTWRQADNPFSFLPQRLFERNTHQFLTRAQESKVGTILQGLSEKSGIREKVASSWISQAVKKPEMLSGQVLQASANPEAESRMDTEHDWEYLLSYPKGLSLVIMAEDDGTPHTIQLIAN